MKGDEDTKYLVSSTHKYSDGTETVVNYVANPNIGTIETTVAEAIEGHVLEEEVPKKRAKKE